MKKKNKSKRSCESRKRLTLFISNGDMNDIIIIIKSLEDSNVLTNAITETVKREIKTETRRRISSSFFSTFDGFFSETIEFFNSKRYKWKRN